MISDVNNEITIRKSTNMVIYDKKHNKDIYCILYILYDRLLIFLSQYFVFKRIFLKSVYLTIVIARVWTIGVLLCYDLKIGLILEIKGQSITILFSIF